MTITPIEELEAIWTPEEERTVNDYVALIKGELRHLRLFYDPDRKDTPSQKEHLRRAGSKIEAYGKRLVEIAEHGEYDGPRYGPWSKRPEK